MSRSFNPHCEISVANSSVDNLNADNSYAFTGEWEQTSDPELMVNLYADKDCSVFVQFSNDGNVVHSVIPRKTSLGSDGKYRLFTTIVKGARYHRVIVSTESLTTTEFSLQTQVGVFRQGNAPLNTNASLYSDAQLVRPTNFQDEVRIGRRIGVEGWNKFAYRSGLTAAEGEQTVWNASGNHTILTTASTFTITYNNTTDGSGGSATGALTITFTYIDANGLPQTSTHTLGSSGSDVTSFSGLGINRAVVSSSDGANGNVNDITITATTGGTTQAKILAGEGVTQQAIFFVGSNHLAVAKYLWINVLRISGGGSPRVLVKAYVFNRNITTKFLVFRCIIDTAVANVIEITEPIGFNLSPSDIIYFVADTDTNSTDIDLRFSLNEYQRT